MNSQLTPTRLVSAGVVLLLTKHVITVYFKMAPAPRRRITEVDSIPDSLNDSATRKTMINPHGHTALVDSRFMDVDVPPAAQGLKDEALLAAFVRGFFGGRVFAPERALLRLARPDLVKFTAIPSTSSSLPPPIWDIERFEGDVLPPLYTILFGAFQVAHVELAEPSSSVAAKKKKTEASSSYVDIVFGSDTAQFAGVHRFTILRDGSKRPDSVRVYISHMSCNPTVDKPLKPDILFSLHKAYAMWLFREAVAEVMRRIRAEKP